MFKRFCLTSLGALLSMQVNAAVVLSEGFDTVTPNGWTVVNNSAPTGTTSWFQGNSDIFKSQSGAAESYAAANFNSGENVATISNWLITPTLTFNNGDVLSFFTRTEDESTWPDRLEVRFSSVGGTNVGSLDTSVGDFTSLLLTINPNQDVSGYPEGWTNYSVSITGLSGPSSGAIGFRYYVANGGPNGDNSNYIGIDTVTITEASGGGSTVPEPSSLALLGTSLASLLLLRRKL